MTHKSKIQRTSGGSAVILRGAKSRSTTGQHAKYSRLLPKSLCMALASAFSAASVSLSQTITGLSLTLAGLASAQAQSAASSLPQGGVAVHGSANIQQNGSTLNVNTTNGAGNRSAINWQSFNIGAGHTTNINQPNAQSSSLNRVITNVPTQIHGTLRSNGQVILVNQNGIAVGSGGVVDTAGFTASTLNISDADYKAKKLRFEGNGLSGGVQIDGVIRSSNGDILLFAPNLATGKDALVRADNGNVIVGAGQSVEVTGRGLEGVKFLIQSADNKAINLGTLQGNAVGVFAGTLRHSGVIQAQAASMEGGRVVLRAIKDVEIVRDPSLATSPRIHADGGVNSQGVAQNGGNIRIESAQGNITVGAGSQISANAVQAQNFMPNQPVAVMNAAGGAIEIIANQGRVSAEAGSAISAQGSPGGTIRLFGGQNARIGAVLNVSSPSFGPVDSAGTLLLIGPGQIGGTIQILSPNTVNLIEGAQLLASGDSGGGTILVGGDYQGANAEIANAQDTNISQGVLLEASARVNGDGGKVIVWADNDTHFSGNLQAKGGEQGGDGGFGETSGKGALYYRGRADLGARRGRVGTLLLDPTFILIAGGATLGSADGNDSDLSINTLNDSGNGGGLGEVRNTNAAATFTINESEIEGTNANIVLQATNKITATGLFTGGDLALQNGRSLTLQVTAAGTVGDGIDLALAHVKTSGGGSINLSTTSSTGNGGITLGQVNTNGGTLSATAQGEITLKALISSANGNVSLNGESINFSNIVTNGAINAGSGQVTLSASGGNGIAMASSTSVSGSLIKLKADKISINSAASLAVTDRIKISAASGTLGIAVGGTQDDATGVRLGITSAELARLTAPTLVFGDLSSANPITLAGDISRSMSDTLALETMGQISQAATLNLEVGSLRVQGAAGVGLGGSNTINTLSGSATNGYFYFKGSDQFKVGAVDGLSGLTAGGPGQSLYLNASGGTSVIILESDIDTAGASVQLDAAFVKIGTSSVTVDTGGPVGSSGDISFGTVALASGVPTITGGVIFAAAPGKTLNLNTAATSTSSNGGNIYLAKVSNHGGAGSYLKHLNIIASPGSGGQSGIVHLTGNVELNATGTLLSNAATLQVGGAPLRIHSSAVVIDTNAANETLTPGGSILLGAIQGTSSNAELTLRAKGGPNGSGGIIEMGAVSTFTGTLSGYLGGLTADASDSSTGMHGEIRLNADIQTNPIFGTGEINLDGHVIVQAPSVMLRSSAAGNDYGGDISVAWFGSVSASAPGYSLTLNSSPDSASSMPEESGAISVGFVSNIAGGSFLRHLTITAAHPTMPGDINLHTNIYLDRGPAAGDAASLLIEGGQIRLHNSVLIDTLQSTTGEGGGVTLRADSISAINSGFDFSILTNTADPILDGGRVILEAPINSAAGFAPSNVVINTEGGSPASAFVDLYSDIKATGSVDIRGRTLLYNSVSIAAAAGANNINITLVGELNDGQAAGSSGLTLNTGSGNTGLVDTTGLEIGGSDRILDVAITAGQADLGVINTVGGIDVRVAGSLFINGSLSSNGGGSVYLEAGNNPLTATTLAINANISSIGRDSFDNDNGELGGNIAAFMNATSGTLQIANGVQILSQGGNGNPLVTAPGFNGGHAGSITLDSNDSFIWGNNVTLLSQGGQASAGADALSPGDSGHSGGLGGNGGMITIHGTAAMTLPSSTSIASYGGAGGAGGRGADGVDGNQAAEFLLAEEGGEGGYGGSGGSGGSGGAISISGGSSTTNAPLIVAGSIRSQGGSGGFGGDGGAGGSGGDGAMGLGEGPFDKAPANGGTGGDSGSVGLGGTSGGVSITQLGIPAVTLSVNSANIQALAGSSGADGDAGLGGSGGSPDIGSIHGPGANGSDGLVGFSVSQLGGQINVDSDGHIQLIGSWFEGKNIYVNAYDGDLTMDALSAINGSEGGQVDLSSVGQLTLAAVSGDYVRIVAPDIVAAVGFAGDHVKGEEIRFGDGNGNKRANVGSSSAPIKIGSFGITQPTVGAVADSEVWLTSQVDLTVGGILTHVGEGSSGTISIATTGALTTTALNIGEGGNAGVGNNGLGDVGISLSGANGLNVASSTNTTSFVSFKGIFATGSGSVALSSSNSNVAIDASVKALGTGGIQIQAPGVGQQISILDFGRIEAIGGVVSLQASTVAFTQSGGYISSGAVHDSLPGVVLIANSFAIGEGTIASPDSPVALMPFTPAYDIHVVSNGQATPSTLELNINDLAAIDAPTLQLGNANMSGGAVAFKTAYDTSTMTSLPAALNIFGSTLTQDAGAILVLNQLAAKTKSGVTLLGSGNDINEISGRVTLGGDFKLVSTGDLKVSTGGALSGITVAGTGGSIHLQASGKIDVYGDMDAGAGADSSSVILKALGGAVTIDYGATVSGKNTAGVSVAITAQDLALNGTVDARGGGVSINPTSSAIGLGLGEGTSESYKLEDDELPNFLNYSNFYAGHAMGGDAFKSITINQTADFGANNAYLRAAGLVSQSASVALTANVLHVEAATVNLAGATNSVNVFSANVLSQGEGGSGGLSFMAASGFDIGSAGIAVAATDVNSGFVSLTSLGGDITNTLGKTIQAGPGGMLLTADGSLGSALHPLRVKSTGNVGVNLAGAGDAHIKSTENLALGSITTGAGENILNITSDTNKSISLTQNISGDDSLRLSAGGSVFFGAGSFSGANATITAQGGSITSGVNALDLNVTGLTKVTAFGDIGAAGAPLAVTAGSFDFGYAGAGSAQDKMYLELARAGFTFLKTSDVNIDASKLSDLFAAAGSGVTEIRVDNDNFQNNVINATLSIPSGTIRVTRADIEFSGAGSATLDALNTVFETKATISSGHTVTVTSGNSTISSPGGWLQGNGRLNNAGKTLLVDGTISPGLSNAIGTLTVSGNLLMGSTGVMDLQIGTNATNGDLLVMGGNLDSNAGTLRITESALSATALGTAYTLATFVGSQGSFPTIDQTTGNFNVGISASTLTVTPISLTNKWTNPSSDFWHVASNWSRNVVPTASHDVWIDVAIANPVVTVGSAAVAKSLRVGDTLTLNTSLGITGGMSVLSGGTFNHINGASGTVSAGGNITIDAGGVMNWAGGTIGLSSDTTQQFISNGVINIAGPGSSLQNLYRNWSNSGIVNWTGGRRIDLLSNNSGPITFTNAALGQINLTTTLAGTDDFINGGSGNIINQGTITSASSNAATTTRLNVTSNAIQNTGKIISNVGILSIGTAGTLANDTGSYTVATGAGLSFAGGRTLNSGASITGAGQLGVSSGTLTANSGVSLGVLTAGSVNLAGGLNLFMGSAQTISNLTLSAGSNITTGDALSISTLNAAGGKFSGTGLFTTTGNSTITGQLEREGGNWLNSGNATFNSSGLIYLNNTSTLTNDAAGSMSFLSTGSTAIYSGSGSNRFINQGTLSNGAGAVSRQVSVAFDNSGVVNVNAGRLFLDSTTSGSESGIYNVASGAKLQINASRNFTSLSAGAGLFGAGFLDIQGGGTQVSFSAGVGTSLLQTGTLQVGSGKLTINTGAGLTFNNTVQLINGTISHANAITGALYVAGNSSLTSPAGGTTWTLPSLTTSSLAMASGSTFTTSNSILQNFGTVDFSGDGTLSLGNSFTNQGVVNLTGNGALAGGVATFNNTSAGTVNRNISGGTFTISSPFAQGGTLSANTGTLAFTSALTNFGLLQGSARINVGGTGLTNDTAGTIAPGGFGSVATLTIAGNADLSTGNLLFDLQTPAFSDRLAVTGNVVFGTAPLKLSELSTVFVGNNISLVTFGGSVSGSLPALDTTAIPDVSFSRSTTGSSNGALVASVSAVTTRWKDTATDQFWTTGSNWTRGHMPTALEDVVINPTGMQTVTLSGASGNARSIALLGDDTLRISGQSLTLAASSTIAPGASLVLASNALLTGLGTLNLSGTLIASGTGNLSINNFNNSGLVKLNNSGDLLQLNTFGLDNGTYDIASGAVLSIVGASRNFGNTMNLSGNGTLKLDGSGTLLTISSGVGGDLLANGTLDISAGNALFSSFTHPLNSLKLKTAGTLTTSSSADAIDVINLSANGGKITGPGTLTTSGNSSVTGVLRLDAGNWVNSGSLSFSASGSFDAIELSNNATLTNTNSGTISSNNMQDFAVFSGATLGTGGTVNNFGLIELADATTNTRDFSVTQLNNSGTLKLIGTGRIALAQANFAQAGTLTLAGGAKLFANSMTNTGLIEGVGTLEVASGTVTNGLGGIFAPGDVDGVAGLGTLTVMGNLDLGTGSKQIFNMALGGSDRIVVNGNLNFSGSSGPLMDISEFGGASFLGGELVTLMTATGSFTSGAQATTGSGDVTFMGNADIANKRYTAEVIGIQNIWNTATPTGGDWYSNSNWSRGVAPNAYHDVSINQASNNLVTISAGAGQARSINLGDGFNQGNTLSVSGSGSLTGNNLSEQNVDLINIWGGNTLNLSAVTLALGDGSLRIKPGGVLNLNAATVTALATSSGDADIANEGLINHIAGTSKLGQMAGGNVVLLENSSAGTIAVQAGTLQVQANSFYQNALITLASAASTLSYLNGTLENNGTIDLAGGHLDLGVNQLSNAVSAKIRGTGAITTGNLVNEGTIAPGAPSAIGSLTISGDFTSDTTGVLQIRADSATTSDQLIIGGSSIGLAGTLSFGALGGHALAAGNNYQPIVSTSGTTTPTGGFSALSGIGLLVSSTNSQLSGYFVTLSNPAGSIVWIGDDGKWDVASNWRDGDNANRLPRSGDIVIINPSGPKTITVDSGTDLTTLSFSSTGGDDVIFITSGGALSLAGSDTLNGTLHIAGGTFTNAGANTGSNAAKNIFMSSGQINVDAAFEVQTLTFQGGALNISSGNTLSLTKNGNWNGPAPISGGGNFHIANTGVLTISGSGQRVITGTNIINDGSLRMEMASGADQMDLASGSMLTNTGTVSATGGGGTLQTISGSGTLNNQGGTLLVEESNILLIRTSSLNMNGGSLDAGVGTIQIEATTASYTGTLNLLSGATIINEGLHSFNNLTLSGSGVGGTSYLRIQDPGNSGNLSVLYNDVKLDNVGNLQILSGNNTIPNGKTLDVSSGFVDISSNILGAGHIHVDDEIAIINASVSPSIYNNGLVAIFDTVTLSSLTQSSSGGDLRLYNNATLIHGAGSLLNPSGAVISGDGTINVGAGSLINQGLIEVGGYQQVGSMKVIGNADLSAGTMDFDLNSLTSHDKFSATGNIILPSSVKLTEASPFIGSGDSFTLFQSSGGSISGSAPSLSLVDQLGMTVTEVSFSNSNNAGGFAIAVSDITNSWIHLGSGDWAASSNWSRGHSPRAAEDAYIDTTSPSAFVSIADPGMTALSLRFGASSDERIVLSGGTLSIGSGGINMNAGSALVMNSGKLSSAGDMNFDGSMHLNGGQIDIGSTLNSTGMIFLDGTMLGAGSGDWNNSGILKGSGTLGVGSGTFVNTGTIAPGVGVAGIAIITIAGNADFTTGNLDIGLQNLTTYDKVGVTGDLHHGGSITLTETSTSFITGGETLNPLSFGGAFTGSLPSVINTVAGKSFAATNAANVNSLFTLTASGGGPATDVFWDGGGMTDLWSEAANWSTDLLPIPGQKVTLAPSGAVAITLAAGTNVAGLMGLNLDFDDSLFITGGSLELPGANLALNGTVNLQGGTLVGNSTGGSFNSLNWSGGIMAGSGVYTATSLSLAGGGSRVMAMTGGGSLNASTFTSTLGGGKLSLQSGNFIAGTNMVVAPSATLSYDGGQLTSSFFNNQGITEINTGSVELPVTATQTGVFNIANAANLEFSNDTTLAAGAGIVGGSWTIAGGKTVTALVAMQRGTGGITTINGQFNANSNFETDELILQSVGSLAGSGGMLKVNSAYDDSGPGSQISGFASATITQASGDLIFNQELSVTGNLRLSATSGGIDSATSGALLSSNRFQAQAFDTIDAKVQANTLSAASTGGNVLLNVVGASQVEALSTTVGHVASITSNGNLGQVAAITTSGKVEFDLGTNGVSWLNTGNVFGEGVHIVTAGAVQLISSAASPMTVSGAAASLQLGGGEIQLGSSASTLNVSGPLTVVASGNITQGATLNISGMTDLSSSSADILLPIPSSYAGDVLLGASGAATINSNRLDGINFGASAVNTLNLTAVGPVTQSAPIEVTGLATVDASGQAVQWLQQANDIGSLQINASTLQLADKNGLILNGTVALTTDINFSGALSTSLNGFTSPILNLTSLGSNSSVDMDVNVSGATSFAVANGSYSDITYRNENTGVASLSEITASGNVVLSHGGAMPLPSIQAASLNVTAGGPVTQSGAALLISGDVTVSALGQDITLTEVGNTIRNFSAFGHHVMLVSNQTVNPDIDATGSVSITASDILQAAGNAINSVAFSASVTGGLGLFGNNNLGSFTADAGLDIDVRNGAGDLNLGQVTSLGNAVIKVGGHLSRISGTVQAAGTVILEGENIGSAADPIVVDAPKVRATAGLDAYLQNQQASSLEQLTASGTAAYASIANISVVGNVEAEVVELRSMSDLVIGNTNRAVLVEAGNLILLEGTNVSLIGGNAVNATSVVRSAGSIQINAAGNFVIQGGSASEAHAAVQALGSVNALLGGTLYVLGGSALNASAELDPAAGSSLDITASEINVQGGSGAGAFAAIVSDGDITLNAGSLNLLAGTGADADALVISNFGTVSLPAVCNGCVNLSGTSLGDGRSGTGVFSGGQPFVEEDITSNASTQLLQIDVLLEELQSDPEEEERRAEPEIVVEGQTCN